MGEVLDKWGEAKVWWKSKTIIGILIAAVGAIIKMVWPETEIDVQGGVDTVIEGGDSLAQGIDTIYGTVLEIIGLAVAIWGRLKAKVGIK